MKDAPLISVCIPVYDTEPYLAQCLFSVYTQDFPSFEIIVVSDASTGHDQKGHSAKKIVKIAQKESGRYRKEKNLPPVKINFIENRENRGLIEVRRTLAIEAKGFYMTQCDSDDEMEEGALSALFASSGLTLSEDGKESSFDIVHGTSTAGTFDDCGNFMPSEQNRYGAIFYGTIEGHEIFRKWLLEGKFTANTWGKLIKRELWLKAYENIPYTECNMADDVLLFFFLAQYAKSYIGIKNKVYHYRQNSGMSSRRKIDTLKKWKMICSTASVFTIISQWIEGQEQNEAVQKEDLQTEVFPLYPDETNRIRRMTRFYLANNLKQMKEAVVPELQEKARSILCEYWGAGFVERIEKS
ncbi:MAG: glycosyltransferase family 2 protein [Treponema sp.]|nr:glycosyltransferase family 2 protein [Treponema sp.]